MKPASTSISNSSSTSLAADDVPGKIVLDNQTLFEQQQGLEKIAQQLRRERLDREAEEGISFGFCPKAELFNGR